MTNNKYILTIVDEFSRFPLALPCSNVETKTVVTKLWELFWDTSVGTFRQRIIFYEY